MIYAQLVRDFAARTRANLASVRQLQRERPDLQVYEVTQLVNSLLGIIVFPEQDCLNRIPLTPPATLRRQGWPVPEPLNGCAQIPNLREYVRCFRNAIAHCNIRFIDAAGEISGLELWNQRNGNVDWRARFSLAEIETMIDKLDDLFFGEDGACVPRGG